MTTFEELSFLKGREQEALLAAGFSNALDLLEWLPKRRRVALRSVFEEP